MVGKSRPGSISASLAPLFLRTEQGSPRPARPRRCCHNAPGRGTSPLAPARLRVGTGTKGAKEPPTAPLTARGPTGDAQCTTPQLSHVKRLTGPGYPELSLLLETRTYDLRKTATEGIRALGLLSWKRPQNRFPAVPLSTPVRGPGAVNRRVHSGRKLERWPLIESHFQELNMS